MKKNQLLLIVCLMFGSAAFAQPKAVYGELGGPGLASFNYDMRFKNTETGAGFRAGIGGFNVDGESVLTIPVGLNYLLGKDGKNYFEVGAGFTYLSYKDNYLDEGSTFTSSFGNLTLGYRLAPANGGFFFKAQMTPVFGKGFFIPYYGGVAFGYKF